MSRAITSALVGIVLLLGSGAEAAQVQLAWSGTVPLPGVGSLTLTNPNVSPGETWTLTYEMDDTPPAYPVTDPALTATIVFSGGYSTPVSA